METITHRTKVIKGAKIEFSDPRLKEGQVVEIIIRNGDHDWTETSMTAFEKEWLHPANDVWDDYFNRTHP